MAAIRTQDPHVRRAGLEARLEELAQEVVAAEEGGASQEEIDRIQDEAEVILDVLAKLPVHPQRQPVISLPNRQAALVSERHRRQASVAGAIAARLIILPIVIFGGVAVLIGIAAIWDSFNSSSSSDANTSDDDLGVDRDWLCGQIEAGRAQNRTDYNNGVATFNEWVNLDNEYYAELQEKCY